MFIKRDEERKKIEGFIDAQNMWEIGKIGLMIKTNDDQYVSGYDLSPEEVKDLICRLHCALIYFDEMESVAQQHDWYMDQQEKQND